MPVLNLERLGKRERIQKWREKKREKEIDNEISLGVGGGGRKQIRKTKE